MGIRVTVGNKVYTEAEAIKKGLISKKEAELIEKTANLVRDNLRTSRKKKSKKRR